MYDPNDEKHAESVKKYPDLPLSDGEFVVADVHRHPIGIISIWLVDVLVILLVIAGVIGAYRQPDVLSGFGITINPDLFLGIGMLLTILLLLLGWVGATIYLSNRFYVTNESVIQHIRTGLFATREQIIALSGVEDASYHQDNFLQYILGYGSIRLSTIGDETTYRYTLVSNPETELRTLNDVVEEFKRRQPDSSGRTI